MRIKCPYCKMEQSYYAPEKEVRGEHSKGQELQNCDPEIGGCDKYYAVFWQASISVQVIGLVEDEL